MQSYFKALGSKQLNRETGVETHASCLNHLGGRRCRNARTTPALQWWISSKRSSENITYLLKITKLVQPPYG